MGLEPALKVNLMPWSVVYEQRVLSISGGAARSASIAFKVSNHWSLHLAPKGYGSWSRSIFFMRIRILRGESTTSSTEEKTTRLAVNAAGRIGGADETPVPLAAAYLPLPLCFVSWSLLRASAPP